MKVVKLALIVGVLVAPAVLWQVNASAQRMVGPLPATVANLATVKSVIIKDSNDQVVLQADFATAEETTKEVERLAMLGSGSGAAHGKAEIELERSGDTVGKQEIEVALRKLTPQTEYKLYVDGVEVAAFSTNKSGNADLKYSTKVQTR